MSGDRMRVPPPSNIEPPDHPLRVAQQALASLMAQAGFALPDPVEQWKAPDEEAASILGAMLDAGIVVLPSTQGCETCEAVERIRAHHDRTLGHGWTTRLGYCAEPDGISATYCETGILLAAIR